MVGLHAAPEIRGFNEDLCEYYRLPRFGIGGLSGAKDVDQQAAYEAALTLITSAQSGAQLIHDVGYLDNGKTGSLDQLIICNEIIGWVNQYMKDLIIDDETIAPDLIDEIVKADGDFLGSEHTCAHYREDYYPELTERTFYEDWAAAGCKTLRDRAAAKVDEILESHRAAPVSGDILDRIHDLI